MMIGMCLTCVAMSSCVWNYDYSSATYRDRRLGKHEIPQRTCRFDLGEASMPWHDRHGGSGDSRPPYSRLSGLTSSTTPSLFLLAVLVPCHGGLRGYLRARWESGIQTSSDGVFALPVAQGPL